MVPYINCTPSKLRFWTWNMKSIPLPNLTYPHSLILCADTKRYHETSTPKKIVQFSFVDSPSYVSRYLTALLFGFEPPHSSPPKSKSGRDGGLVQHWPILFRGTAPHNFRCWMDATCLVVGIHPRTESLYQSVSNKIDVEPGGSVAVQPRTRTWFSNYVDFEENRQFPRE